MSENHQKLTPKQQFMLAQVEATMAIENMHVTKAARQNAIDILTSKKTEEQVIKEIKEKYVNAR